jgi:hypothetical protein
MQKLKSKLPIRKEVLAVFSTAVFISFSWSIYHMFFQVPSWLFYLTLNDILWISAYVLGFALLESAFLLGFMILLSILYPKKHYKNKFVAQSSLILLILTIGALLYQQNIGMLKWWGWLELLIFILAFISCLTVLVLSFSFLFDRVARLKGLMEAIADRLTVFSLIYLPLGVLGLIVMIFRNLFSL